MIQDAHLFKFEYSPSIRWNNENGRQPSMPAAIPSLKRPGCIPPSPRNFISPNVHLVLGSTHQSQRMRVALSPLGSTTTRDTNIVGFLAVAQLPGRSHPPNVILGWHGHSFGGEARCYLLPVTEVSTGSSCIIVCPRPGVGTIVEMVLSPCGALCVQWLHNHL